MELEASRVLLEQAARGRDCWEGTAKVKARARGGGAGGGGAGTEHLGQQGASACARMPAVHKACAVPRRSAAAGAPGLPGKGASGAGTPSERT